MLVTVMRAWSLGCTSPIVNSQMRARVVARSRRGTSLTDYGGAVRGYISSGPDDRRHGLDRRQQRPGGVLFGNDADR